MEEETSKVRPEERAGRIFQAEREAYEDSGQRKSGRFGEMQEVSWHLSALPGKDPWGHLLSSIPETGMDWS